MNNPSITAYALNELQGAEREKFESDLASDPHLQRDLLAACELTDALGEVTEEPSEGLEPQAREKLLRAIVANQETFRARRKIIRFAVPVSLAAAASIAVLLLVSGGTTTHKPAVAAASAPGAAGSSGGKKPSADDKPSAIPDRLLSIGFAAPAKSGTSDRVFQGYRALSGAGGQIVLQAGSEAGQQTELALAEWRTVQLRASAGSAGQMAPLDPTEIRVRGLRWESPQTLGLGGENDGFTEFLAP